MKKIFILILLIFFGLTIFSPIFAQEKSYKLEIHFFYSETCPHCAAEQKFLDKIEQKYSEVEIKRHLISEATCRKEMIDLCKKYNLEKYIGLVPLTFVGEEFFLGFDNENGIGKKIEESIQRQLKENGCEPKQGEQKFYLPIIGELDVSKYSLPALAVILGVLDGFNVCSLGALILILGLVLALRSRKKILIFGGIFILTTTIIYGLLIILWHQLFSFFASYEKVMEILVGILGIGGGAYFLKEFIKFRKHGPTCETEKKGITLKLVAKIQEIFKKPEKVLPIVMGILLLAALLTIVEFPCSAAVPVVFAGILAKVQLPAVVYLLYIALYLVFYMLDEILIFLIALFTLKLWLASPKFITWITLVEAIILFMLGFYYLIRLF